jgi:predicted nucleic acid-binding protein
MTYAIDANVIIDYVNGETDVMAEFRNAITSAMPMVITDVVDFEVVRGFYHNPSKHKEASYAKIRQICPIVKVNDDIWDCAASLWAKLRKSGLDIGDADVIIAAHCIINDYTLITRNTKHFTNVDGLKMLDWRA